MNMNSEPANEQEKVDLLQQITPSDGNFGPWLKKYIQRYPLWIGNGEKYDYWLVDYENIKSAVAAVVNGREYCFLNIPFEGKIVLAIKHEPSWLSRKLGDIASKFLWICYAFLLRASDFALRWGEKTCPRCFSRDLYPFTVTVSSKDEQNHPHYYCSGCNTIWPRRSH